MAASLAELLTPVTVDEAETLILALLEAVGFPATSWQRVSVPRTLVRLTAELYSDARTGLVATVRSRLLDYAEGDALTAIASNFFELERDPATPTEGVFVLTDDGGAPYEIAVGQLMVRDVATGLRYTNIEAGSLAVSGSVPLTFRAEQPGSTYNIASGATLEFVGTFEGVLVTNPADITSGTWITEPGTDAQPDVSLREECRARWATIGAGTESAYEAWAREGAPTVTKVRVYADEPNGPGTILIVMANDTGGASVDEVADADAIVQAKRPVGIGGVEVRAATAVPVVVTATAYVYSAWSTTYTASLSALRDEFQAELEIGEDVYLSRLTTLLELGGEGGVRNVVIDAPVGDTVVGVDEIGVVNVAGVTVVVV